MSPKVQSKNLYEVVMVVGAGISDENIEKNISQVTSAIKNYGGNVVKVDDPIHRRFTHRIKGEKEGFYISVLFNSPPEVPNTLKRTLSISDEVIRYMVVKREHS